MKRLFLFTLLTLTSLIFTNEVIAQDKVPRFEVGGQFSLLSPRKPAAQLDFFVESPYKVEPGFGGRFTYNFTNEIAFDAEGNFFPGRYDFLDAPSGHILQGQFGIKAGKRFNKVGIFGKARPGFVTFSKVSHLTNVRLEVVNVRTGGFFPLEVPEFRIDSASYLSADLGGVVEFYPAKRIVTRFDIGDTIIRYGAFQEPQLNVCPLSAPVCPLGVFARPEETKHSLQFSAGVSFRF